jgi:hypothetical protein
MTMLSRSTLRLAFFTLAVAHLVTARPEDAPGKKQFARQLLLTFKKQL